MLLSFLGSPIPRCFTLCLLCMWVGPVRDRGIFWGSMQLPVELGMPESSSKQVRVVSVLMSDFVIVELRIRVSSIGNELLEVAVREHFWLSILIVFFIGGESSRCIVLSLLALSVAHWVSKSRFLSWLHMFQVKFLWRSKKVRLLAPLLDLMNSFIAKWSRSVFMIVPGLVRGCYLVIWAQHCVPSCLTSCSQLSMHLLVESVHWSQACTRESDWRDALA